MEAAGAERVSGPAPTSTHSVTARLIAPDHLPVSVFDSLDSAGFSEPARPSSPLPQHDSGSAQVTAQDETAGSTGETAEEEKKSGIHSLIYSSRVMSDLSDHDLIDLLDISRRNNDRLGLTGVLLYRQGRFLQYLEGPRDALLERVRIIAADDRHTSFVTLLEEDIPRRLFPAWSMGFERLTERGASDIPGYRTSFADLSEKVDDEAGTRGVLGELSRWFADRSGAAQF
jgi:hypothetical protein